MPKAASTPPGQATRRDSPVIITPMNTGHLADHIGEFG
jgi:hypothetical protein